MAYTATDIIPTLTRTKDPKLQRMQKAILNPLHVVREMNNRSLFNFIKFFWSTISNDEFKPNWHIEYLCKELEQISQRVAIHQARPYDLIINIPPGSTKTIVVNVMWPVWCWTKWYWMRFISSGYSATLSLEASEYSRDIIRSELFKLVYPELQVKEDKDTKSNYKVILRKDQGAMGRMPIIQYGGNRYSTSVGGTLTGFHGHILIVDDPINPNQAASKVELDKANHWISQTLSTRKTDKAVTPTVVVMQRLHQNDPSGYWLSKNKKNVKHICIPGEIVNYKEQLQPPELEKYYIDGLMDPVRLSWEVLRDLEQDLGQYGYSGQIGQKPVPPGGGMFKVDNFSIIDTLPSPVNFIRTVRYWDKAGSTGKGAYTVGVKMSLLEYGRYIIHDIKRGQWASEERERIIRQTADADGGDVTIYIEQEPGSGGKESAEATIRNLNGFVCYADCPTGDKVFRADPYSVQVNNGQVRLLRGAWNQPYTDECENFPFGTYKDQVDASSGAYSKLTGKRIAKRIT